MTTKCKKTMDMLYGDGSKHWACKKCGFCLDCKDCNCHKNKGEKDEL